LKKGLRELIYYGICGTICTLLNFILFVLFEQMSMHYLLANSASYAIAVVVNYFLNRKFVFKTAGQHGMSAKSEFIKFTLVRLGSLAADNTLLYIVVDMLWFNIYFGEILISIGIIMVTFIINKLFVFRLKGDQK